MALTNSHRAVLNLLYETVKTFSQNQSLTEYAGLLIEYFTRDAIWEPLSKTRKDQIANFIMHWLTSFRPSTTRLSDSSRYRPSVGALGLSGGDRYWAASVSGSLRGGTKGCFTWIATPGDPPTSVATTGTRAAWQVLLEGRLQATGPRAHTDRCRQGSPECPFESRLLDVSGRCLPPVALRYDHAYCPRRSIQNTPNNLRVPALRRPNENIRSFVAAHDGHLRHQHRVVRYAQVGT